MIVTDLNISIDNYLLRKLNLMVSRMSDKVKGDCLLICNGSEGSGKSNMSFIVAKYISFVTGRDFTHKNVFFDVDKLIEFAQNNEQQIIIWDEPALAGLSNEWYNRNQRNLIKLLMLIRKRRHFFIFNLTKFYKFNPYFIDRSNGMIHTYSHDGITLGRWTYYKEASIQRLAYDWKSKRKESFRLYYNARGTIGYHLPRIVDEKAYEKQKDIAINSIGGDKKVITENKADEKLWIKKFMKNAEEEGVNIKQSDLAVLFGRDRKSISRYKAQMSPKSS